MNSSIDNFDSPTSDANHLFEDDCGTLGADTRRVLVQLLLGPAVDARRQTKLWPILLRDEAAIRTYLHNLFLDLVIDREQEVAFTRQVSSSEFEVPVLLRRAQLTFVESVLVLYLRQRLTQSENQGERAVVDLKDMTEYLRVYERHGNTDQARFLKQLTGAVEKVKKLNFIHKLRGGDDRFEISPTLKLLFPAEEIVALTRLYATLGNNPDALDSETDLLSQTLDDSEESFS